MLSGLGWHIVWYMVYLARLIENGLILYLEFDTSAACLTCANKMLKQNKT